MKYKIAWLMIVALLPLLAGAQMDGFFKKVKTKVNQWVYNKVEKTLHKVEGKKETITKDSVSHSSNRVERAKDDVHARDNLFQIRFYTPGTYFHQIVVLDILEVQRACFR
jgi:hypothetical protein